MPNSPSMLGRLGGSVLTRTNMSQLLTRTSQFLVSPYREEGAAAVPLSPKLIYNEGTIPNHCLKGHCTKGQVGQRRWTAGRFEHGNQVISSPPTSGGAAFRLPWPLAA